MDSLPSSVGISVMSPTHFRFGAVAVTSRFSGSGNFAFVRSCRVRPRFRLSLRPFRPCRRIESATVFTDTRQTSVPPSNEHPVPGQ